MPGMRRDVYDTCEASHSRSQHALLQSAEDLVAAAVQGLLPYPSSFKMS